MSFPKTSLFDTRSLKAADLHFLFRQADRLKTERLTTSQLREIGNQTPDPKVVALLFFEPSTRTRMSFEMAALRLGHRVILLDSASDSSLSKGETYADTVLNVVAMHPDALVIRYGESAELERLLPTLKIPVLNAGSGTSSHPSQALLDAYTIYSLRSGKAPVQPLDEGAPARCLEGERVLIVGDVLHSRVARSNFDVLQKLGAEVAVCGPDSLIPWDETKQTARDSAMKGVKVFRDLDEGVAWCTVYMGLRIQLERHDATKSSPGLQSVSVKDTASADYHAQYGLGRTRLKNLAKDAIIMHPGPINHGVEFAPEVLADSRCQVLLQVENGVLIRAALLAEVLGSSPSGKPLTGSKVRNA